MREEIEQVEVWVRDGAEGRAILRRAAHLFVDALHCIPAATICRLLLSPATRSLILLRVSPLHHSRPLLARLLVLAHFSPTYALFSQYPPRTLPVLAARSCRLLESHRRPAQLFLFCPLFGSLSFSFLYLQPAAATPAPTVSLPYPYPKPYPYPYFYPFFYFYPYSYPNPYPYPYPFSYLYS